MTDVYLSIGSNIDRKKNIRFALHALEEHFGTVHCSTIYQNKAVGFEGDDFYNLVAYIQTDQDVDTVTKTLKEIEQACGRSMQAKKFSPRTLDIDILLFGQHNFQPQRDIPRAEITQYLFVLQPLVEIAPELIHPIHKQTMAELWHAYQPQQPLSQTITL